MNILHYDLTNYDIDDIIEITRYLNSKGLEVIAVPKDLDLLLDCDAVNETLVAELENLGPFGTDNPKPIIILKDAVVLNTKKFGRNKEHLRCIVGTNNVSSPVNTLIVNIFRVSENDVLLNTLGKVGTKCDLIGTLSINKWMNLNNIQFIVDDVIL